jgi:hypothetical protein
MTDIRNNLVALCVASAALGALAQSADEHKDHHPADAGAPAQAVKPPAQTVPAPAQNAAGMAHMDRHMQAMQTMHEKMVAVKTPEERQALMAEHMQLMQQGMAMMKGMGGKGPMAGMPSGAGMGGNMADRQQTLEKRMDMMESMMQMMMDRLPAGAQAPAAPK